MSRNVGKKNEQLIRKIMDEKRKLLVYHGGTELIEHPLYYYGRSLLDFGKGFYVTDIKEQAIMWAKIIAKKRGLEPVVSRYLLDWDSIVRQAKCRLFGYYDEDWLNFVVLCRKGYDPSRKFDYIEGGVADDRVIDTVNSVVSGLMDYKTALKTLSTVEPSSQMCFLNQPTIDKYLEYNGMEII